MILQSSQKNILYSDSTLKSDWKEWEGIEGADRASSMAGAISLATQAWTASGIALTDKFIFNYK